MANLLIVCHVEPRKPDGDVDYLRGFFAEVKKLNKPVILLLMVGERAGDRILKLVKNNPDLIPSCCQIGLHVHSHQTAQAIKLYQKILGQGPKLISFGHWSYTDQDLEIASRFGVKYDLSYAAYRHKRKYFVKERFKTHGLMEIPVCCNPKYPLDPFYTKYNFLLHFILVLFPLFSSKTLHFAFHSYDWNKYKASIIFNLPAEYVTV